MTHDPHVCELFLRFIILESKGQGVGIPLFLILLSIFTIYYYFV